MEKLSKERTSLLWKGKASSGAWNDGVRLAIGGWMGLWQNGEVGSTKDHQDLEDDHRRPEDDDVGCRGVLE
jgi:hypothetical protein